MKRKPPASERIKELQSLLTDATDAVAELESLLMNVGAEKRNYAGTDEWFFPLAVIQAKEMESLLFRVGAEKQGDHWYWPFYQHAAPTVMMSTEDWIKARKKAAEVLSKAIDGEYDSTSSNVLPDSRGRDITD